MSTVYIFKDLISKSGHIQRSWELGHEYIFWGEKQLYSLQEHIKNTRLVFCALDESIFSWKVKLCLSPWLLGMVCVVGMETLFLIPFLYSKIAGEFTFLNFDFVGKIKHEWKQKPISFRSLCLGLCLTEVQLSGGISLYNEIVVKLWLLLLGWETADRFSSPLPAIGSSQFGLMWCIYSSFIQQIPIQLLLLKVTEGNIFRARYL